MGGTQTLITLVGYLDPDNLQHQETWRYLQREIADLVTDINEQRKWDSREPYIDAIGLG